MTIGSQVAAEAFDSLWHHYGTVIRLTPKGCILEIPSSEYEQRISYAKYAVRIVDNFEWNRALMQAEDIRKRVDADMSAEMERQKQERDVAIAARAENMRRTVYQAVEQDLM